MACFAPISRGWPARKLLLSNELRRALERPIPEIPPELDRRYFHAAPPELRLERLLGGEHLLFEGLHPALPAIRSRLPISARSRPSPPG